MVEAILRRVRTGTRDTIAFSVPPRLVEAFRAEFAGGVEYFQVKVKRPSRGRTTGKWSQNHHINGHVAQIAEATGNDFEDVKEAAKLRAMKRGYPADTLPNGWLVPRSETTLTTEEAGHLIEELHQIAAELEIHLREGV